MVKKIEAKTNIPTFKSNKELKEKIDERKPKLLDKKKKKLKNG